MKLLVLVDMDKYGDMPVKTEGGLCIYLEEGDKRVLLDTGCSTAYRDNAEYFRLDLSRLTTVVLSHGHYDHTDGMPDLLRQPFAHKLEVVTHPGTFGDKCMADGQFVGSAASLEQVNRACGRLTLSEKPYWLTDRLVFLGQIPRRFEFEGKAVINMLRDSSGCMADDPLLDDSALAYKGEEGVYVITGCSHSGICNIIEYAKEVCKDSRVAGVIGGFHLRGVTPQTEPTIDYLEGQRIGVFAPCHCVDLPARQAMAARLPVETVAVGYRGEWL